MYLKSYPPGFNVVNGKDFVFQKNPGFYGEKSEQEYLDFMIKCQLFFKSYAHGTAPHDYWIEGRNAGRLFTDIGTRVSVSQGRHGLTVATNGRHRAFIAWKYHLRLLVYLE